MHSIEELAGQHFDAIIVGGGINGAGLARDLALRANVSGHPMRVLLLERSFWGTGTSGKNSHLIHGGLRYLKYFDFALVKEALRERALLLKLAPDTVRPLRFELTAQGPIDRIFYGAGIALYDLLAGANRIGSSSYFSSRLKDQSTEFFMARVSPCTICWLARTASDRAVISAHGFRIGTRRATRPHW